MNSKNFFAGLATAAILASNFVVPAQAQTPTQIKQNKAWGAYMANGSSGKVCYVLSTAVTKEPADRDHGDVYFMLAMHPGQSSIIEPQFTVGYPFKDNSKVTLTIDGKSFSMFTKGSSAWMENPAEEATVVAAMRAGSNMSLKGQSRRGTETRYTYSLSGVTASLKDVANCK